MEGKLADFVDPQVHFIPLDELEISELNVRRREITADIDELANSIEIFGLQQPIVVQRRGDRFDVVVGQRRYLAAKHLGWDQIPAFILREPLKAVQATIFSFSENIQRRDLHREDKAEACSYLLGELGSAKAVAQELGITEQTVKKWLGFAAVPPAVKELVHPKGLTVQQAIRIAHYVEDDEVATEIAKRVAGMAPVKEDRDRVLEAVQELPGRSVDTIFRRAEEKRVQKHIHFILTESSAKAIDQAATKEDTEADEIAMGATIQWLQDNNYLP